MVRRTGILAALSLTLLLTACGDDDESATTTDAPSGATQARDEPADAPTSAGTDTAITAPESTGSEPADTAAPDSPATDGTPSIPDDLSGLTIPAGVDLNDQCQAIADGYANAVTDPDAFGNLRNAFDDLKDAAPDELDPDIDVVLEVYDVLATRVEEDGVDPATALGDPEILDMMSTERFNAAATRIIDFLEPYCAEDQF